MLGSRAVVAAIRIAVIFAAGFIAASVVALVARRQWLTRIGPAQVSELLTSLGCESSQRNLEELTRYSKLLIEGMRDYQDRVHRLLEDLRRAGAIRY